jgi:23S rRNA G2445 N2-methylase RlmL
MSALQNYFAPCAKGLEYLLVDELRALGAEFLDASGQSHIDAAGRV